MSSFLTELKSRNETLFYFGLICNLLALAFLVLSQITVIQVFKVNAWNKPLKFALSIGAYAWTMAWYCYYLPKFNLSLFNWTTVLLLGFELFYIAFQASRGQLSHYNVSNPLYSLLYGLMAVAASATAVYTAYIGWLFLQQEFPTLPLHYLWAIRLGILLFVIFAFEGFAMGSRLNHSVGAYNDNSNLFVLGWSKTVGDLRVAHFIGMHALQVLPILSFYLLKNTKATVVVAALYGLLAVASLVQALQAKPLLR